MTTFSGISELTKTPSAPRNFFMYSKPNAVCREISAAPTYLYTSSVFTHTATPVAVLLIFLNLSLTFPIAIATAICQVLSWPVREPAFSCAYSLSMTTFCRSVLNSSSVSCTAASYPFSAIASRVTPLRYLLILIVSNGISSTAYWEYGISSPSATSPDCRFPVTFFVFKTVLLSFLIIRIMPRTSSSA